MLIEARNVASEAFGKQQVRPGHDDGQSYDPENLLPVIWILKRSIFWSIKRVRTSAFACHLQIFT